MANILYGIKNCDAIKKARRHLDEHAVDYKFHDYRVDGIDEQSIQQFIDTLGWEKVLNKRGTTWRKLDDKTKAATTEENVATLLCEHPAMIKRPILRADKNLVIGFSKEEYAKALALN